jgi:hypothetical protein
MSRISIDCHRNESFILINKKIGQEKETKIKKNDDLSNHPKYFTWCKCHIQLSNNNIYPDKCFRHCELKTKEIQKELQTEPKKEITKEIKTEPKKEKRKKIHLYKIYRAYMLLNINKRPTKKQKINHILK